MNLKDFLTTPRIPVPLRGDAYTLSSDAFASKKAREKSIYNFTNRTSPAKAWPEVAKDSRMVFFGLQDYIRQQLTDKVTYNDVLEAERFMARAGSFGTGLPFNKTMWLDIVYNHNGYLPLHIEAIPEGSIFFPNEPVIQVTSLHKDFGEIAGHIEAIMVGEVSIASARATLTRHWYQSIVDFLVEKGYDIADAHATAQWFIHDFGMRASSNEQESRTLGKAHLLTFKGTDTMNAAYEAWKQSTTDNGVGTSILALAHRNVQGYEYHGKLGEYMAFRAINEAAKNAGDIASYVSDCYNFEKAVDKCASLHRSTGSTIVCRPDSGDAVENVDLVTEVAVANGFYKYGPHGEKADGLRFIEGNSVKPELQREIMQMLSDRGLDPGAWGIFGVGGYLRNSCTRDSLSSAYKLAAIGDENYPVCKLSEIEVKMSIPGRVYLDKPTPDNLIGVQAWGYGEGDNRLQTYYHNGSFDFPTLLEDFDVKRERCLREFNEYDWLADKYPEYGLHNDNLGPEILKIRNETVSKYR